MCLGRGRWKVGGKPPVWECRETMGIEIDLPADLGMAGAEDCRIGRFAVRCKNNVVCWEECDPVFGGSRDLTE